ncbi:MAG TPA: ribonuclease P protein component [Myxococcota bacterium]|nr:ribonuclease P protein component [Myxococcota bacterium]
MTREQAQRRLRRADRLRSARDYARVAREGERRASEHFVLLVAPQRGPGSEGRTVPRLGLTVSRRVGPAVVRSRVKRRIRETFRARRGLLPGSADVVVIARPGAGALDARAATTELAALFEGGAR